MKSEEPVRQPEVEKGVTWLVKTERKKKSGLGSRRGGGGERRRNIYISAGLYLGFPNGEVTMKST